MLLVDIAELESHKMRLYIKQMLPHFKQMLVG